MPKKRILATAVALALSAPAFEAYAQSIAPTTVNGAHASFTVTTEGVTTVTFHATDSEGAEQREQSDRRAMLHSAGL